MTSPRDPARPRADAVRPPGSLRLAGVLVGLQALAALGFAGYGLVRLPSAALGVGSVLGEVGTFAVVGVALLAVARGLVAGRFWARTPAVVVQILLLPVGYSLLVPSHQPLTGLPVLVVTVINFGLLLCPPSREWMERADEVRRRG